MAVAVAGGLDDACDALLGDGEEGVRGRGGTHGVRGGEDGRGRRLQKRGQSEDHYYYYYYS